MAKSVNKNAIARQVELIIRKLGSLSTLPEVAAGFLPHITAKRIDAASLAEIVQSDAALTAKILSLAHSEGVTFAGDTPSVLEAIQKLPQTVVRDAVLSIRVFQAFDVDYDPDKNRILPRKQLALHALAVACCAKSIASLTLTEQEAELAFSAGLLHDIGKQAIDEVMPKSFEKIVAHTKAEGVSMLDAEQEYLGIDHTIIGKRLAERWNFPIEIVNAIWLHHSDAEILSDDIPDVKIARIVALADTIARDCVLGHSGSFDTAGSGDTLVSALGISAEQITEIRHNLPQDVSHRSDMLGLTATGGSAAYCDMISQTAAKLASDNSQLFDDNRKHAINSAHTGLISQFLLSIDAASAPVDIAAQLASCFQKHYQTGPVIVYVGGEAGEDFLDAATVDNTGQIDTAILSVPAGCSALPQILTGKFKIIEAEDCSEWVFEQIDLDIDPAKSFIAPLLSAGRAVGAIIFERRQPGDFNTQLELFSLTASISANVLALACATQRQGALAERFAELLGRLRDAREKIADSKSLIGIAEMAAGAGHELNNPLSVISGRVQLLLESETDDNKKQILKQIRDRSDEISQIISDLMTFARPKDPSPAAHSIRTLLDEAISYTTAKHDLTVMEVSYEGIDDLAEITADKDQIKKAISAILSNALDSYTGGSGPIKIEAASRQTEDAVIFAISDEGCGMDAETLSKATRPFFSDKLAGRKRGMGLAHAVRLVELNNGSLNITSQPEKGTTVTFKLPKAD